MEARCRPPLASSHHEVSAQTDVDGVHFETFPRNETRTQFCQLSFAEMRKQTEKVFSKNDLEDRVTEKLETLIIEMMSLRLVAEARMGQSLGQEKRVSEFVSDSLF